MLQVQAQGLTTAPGGSCESIGTPPLHAGRCCWCERIFRTLYGSSVLFVGCGRNKSGRQSHPYAPHANSPAAHLVCYSRTSWTYWSQEGWDQGQTPCCLGARVMAGRWAKGFHASGVGPNNAKWCVNVDSKRRLHNTRDQIMFLFFILSLSLYIYIYIYLYMYAYIYIHIHRYTSLTSRSNYT